MIERSPNARHEQMTPQSIYVRIAHRFGPRLTEWVVAVQTLLWGVVLLLPPATFDGPTWVFFQSIMPENQWGWLMLFLGVARLGGLIVNGARKRVTPLIRMISAAVGFLIFVGISYSFALSGVISTWIAIYPVIAVVELVNIYRAAHDAGESYASAS